MVNGASLPSKQRLRSDGKGKGNKDKEVTAVTGPLFAPRLLLHGCETVK